MGLAAGFRCDCNRLEWTAPCPHDGRLVGRRELGSDRDVGAVANLLGRLPAVGKPALPLLTRRVLAQREIAPEDLPRLRAELDSLRSYLGTHPEFDLGRDDSAQRFRYVNEGRPALDHFLTALSGLVAEAIRDRKPIHFAI